MEGKSPQRQQIWQKSATIENEGKYNTLDAIASQFLPANFCTLQVQHSYPFCYISALSLLRDVSYAKFATFAVTATVTVASVQFSPCR